MISLISVNKSTEHYGNVYISNDMLNKQFYFFLQCYQIQHFSSCNLNVACNIKITNKTFQISLIQLKSSRKFFIDIILYCFYIIFFVGFLFQPAKNEIHQWINSLVVLAGGEQGSPVNHSPFRISRLQIFTKIHVLKSFANFTGKHLCWILF